MENISTFLSGETPPRLPPVSRRLLLVLHLPTPDSVLSPDQVTAPYLHLGGVLVMTALAWPIGLHFFRMNSKGEVCHVINIKHNSITLHN